MNIRESMEQRERELLSPYASHSADTRGREHPEEECDVRTTYQRDRDRILHCKAFRRMKDKTQVFLAPNLCISFGVIGVIMKLGMPVNKPAIVPFARLPVL